MVDNAEKKGVLGFGEMKGTTYIYYDNVFSDFGSVCFFLFLSEKQIENQTFSKILIENRKFYKIFFILTESI